MLYSCSTILGKIVTKRFWGRNLQQSTLWQLYLLMCLTYETSTLTHPIVLCWGESLSKQENTVAGVQGQQCMFSLSLYEREKKTMNQEKEHSIRPSRKRLSTQLNKLILTSHWWPLVIWGGVLAHDGWQHRYTTVEIEGNLSIADTMSDTATFYELWSWFPLIWLTGCRLWV